MGRDELISPLQWIEENAGESPDRSTSGTGTFSELIAAETEGYYGLEEIDISTTGEIGLMNTWDFIVGEFTAADSYFDLLGDGEVGIMVETEDAANDYSVSDHIFLYRAVFEHAEPTFTDQEWYSTNIYKFSPALADEESAALAEIYGWDSSLSTTDLLNNAMASIAEDAIASRALPAHPLNKIKSPVIDKDAFDVFEKEEAAQAVTVSTATEVAVTY